jgi:FkbM family methyltransferase
MNVFIDVGGHVGQTLAEVTKPLYRFDRIFCFEPMPNEFASLTAKFGDDKRVTLINAGLAERTGERPIFGSNRDMGASLFQTKRDLDDPSVVTVCSFIHVSDFFRDAITRLDLVVMKLNCEGSECIIMNDLIDSGEVWKLANVMIDFDVRKIPDVAQQERQLRRRMRAIGFANYVPAPRAMRGRTHQARINNWLAGLPFRDRIFVEPPPPKSLMERIRLLPWSPKRW